MALSNMQVFNANLRDATAETLAQNVAAFNAASNGAITLTNQGFEGDLLERSFYAALHSAQRRVNRYQPNAAGGISATALSQLKEVGVKVAGGFGPIVFEPSQMTWIQSNEAEAIAVLSQQLADAIIADQLNAGIASAVAAIRNQALTFENPAAGVDYQTMNSAHALFGDASGSIVANVMTGKVYHQLIGANLANTPTLFQASNVTVVDILGKAVVVTDAAALSVANMDDGAQGVQSGDVVLGLSSGGITIFDGSDVVTNIETVNGKERIETTFQADYDFGLGLRGYKWAGANSPSDLQLATGANWDLEATSAKHSAGVVAIGKA